MLDGIDDRQCRGIAVFDEAEQHRTFAVRPDDVLLHQIAVAYMPDIPQEHGGAGLITYRDVVERLDGWRHRIPAEVVIGLADLRIAAWQGQVLRIHRIDDR